MSASCLPRMEGKRFLIKRAETNIPMVKSVNSGRTDLFNSIQSLGSAMLLGIKANDRISLIARGFVRYDNDIRLHPYARGDCVLIKTSLYNNHTCTVLRRFCERATRARRELCSQVRRRTRGFVRACKGRTT